MKTRKLPIAAISKGVLHITPARFYLEKSGNPWVGKNHIENGDGVIITDDRAYIEFRGLETNEGRTALRDYVDAVQSLPEGPENDAANQEVMTKKAIDLICGMVISWRIFDEDGEAIDIEPGELDPDLGTPQVRILMEHFLNVAPRKIIEMANFLRDLKNF